jgi:hypothetical protein
MIPKFCLLVGFYRDRVAERERELISCLERNVANDLFEAVHVVIEEKRPRLPQFSRELPILRHPKVRLVDHGRRSRYADMFAHANCELAGRRVVLANGDIYFDQSLALLADMDLKGRFICLSRWDVQADGSSRLFDHTFSQDVWIFQAPVCSIYSDFCMGSPRCDSRIAWEARQAGLVVSNPSRSIKAHHLHMSGIRNTKQSREIRGDGLGVPSTTLEELGRSCALQPRKIR